MEKPPHMPIADEKARLWQTIDERFDELVRTCSDLVAIPAPNPPGDTRALARYVRQRLEEVGVQVQAHAPKEDRPNLVASLGHGAGPHLLFNSHLDHFPPAGTWRRNPYEAAIEGGRLYGVGVTDMKAGLAASIFVARLLAESDVGLRGRLTFVYSSDEESGGRWGTQWMLENLPALRADACIIGDQSGTSVVGAGEKGICWLHVRTSGRRAHGAYGSRESAVRRLAAVLPVLLSLEDLESPLPQRVGHRPEDPRELVERVTVNIGRVEGGESPNLVAEQAYAYADIRVPVGLKVDDVLQELRARLRRGGHDPVIETLRRSDPSITQPTDGIVRTIAGNSSVVCNAAAEPIVRVGASDGRLFRRHGIPAVVFGAAPGNLGGGDEYVELEELRRIAKVHAGAALDFLQRG